MRAAVRLAVKYTVFGTTRAVKSDSAATTGALAAPRSRAPECAKKRAQSTPHVTHLTANAYVRTSKRPGHDARKLEVIVRSHVRSMVEYVVRRLQVEAELRRNGREKGLGAEAPASSSQAVAI